MHIAANDDAEEPYDLSENFQAACDFISKSTGIACKIIPVSSQLCKHLSRCVPYSWKNIK